MIEAKTKRTSSKLFRIEEEQTDVQTFKIKFDRRTNKQNFSKTFQFFLP